MMKDITLISKCINFIPTSPNIALGEIVAYTMQVVAKRPNSEGFWWLVHLTLNLD